jgi:hypothetical protein
VTSKLHPGVAEVFCTGGQCSHFFGYYDKCPIDTEGNHLLAHRTGFEGRPVTADDTAEVGHYELDSERWRSLGTTAAFNWQQGAMLQWLPPRKRTQVIYNDREDDRFVSVIVDISSRERMSIPHPIYAVHPSGRYALTVNYERLYFCRPGYNYQGVVKKQWDRPLPEGDGIFRVDLQTGEKSLLIGTRRISKMGNVPDQARERYHWLEHMMWNPSGSRFAFLHRWDRPDGGHTTRLFTAAADGSDVHAFPETGFYSHMDWRTDTEFVIWTVAPPPPDNRPFYKKYCPFKTIARPIYRKIRDHLMRGPKDQQKPGNKCFVRMWDGLEKRRPVGRNVLKRNGHNSFSPVDNNLMLTDTYADEDGYRHLMLYSFSSDKRTEIGKFYSPFNRSGYRCDLHPRWSQDGRRVVIDSAHAENLRQVYILELKDPL